MATTIVNSATAEIGQILSYLAELHGKVDQAKALVNLLGWELPPGVEDMAWRAWIWANFWKSSMQ